MSRTPKQSSIVPPTPEEDVEISAAASDDPDAQPLTDAQLAGMAPMRALSDRPKAESKKVLLSVRYSPKVVARHCL